MFGKHGNVVCVNLKDKTAIVVDSGLFFGLAQRLARDFSKVWYYSPWEKWAPFASDVAIGSGYEDEGVYRENYPFHLIDTEQEPDLWVFPHVMHSDFQYLLRKLERRVWGSGEGHNIENDRWQLKEWLDKCGLPVISSVQIVGTDALRDFLEKNEDKYVKVSLWRGDMETYHHVRWSDTQIWWSDLCNRLGPIRDLIHFVVEDPIPDAVETGTDSMIIHGLSLYPMTIGYEKKDALYVAKVVNLSEGLPTIFREPIKAIEHFLKNKDYVNFFSTEMRITKQGQCFLTDATARMPSPPGEMLLELWTNLPEVIYDNSAGSPKTLPRPRARYAAQVILKSNYAMEHWVEVRIPNEVRERVKMFCPTRINGCEYSVPDNDHEAKDIAAVVGFGNSVEDAVNEAMAIADKVEAYEIYYEKGAYEELKEAIGDGEKLGIDF